MPFGRQTFKKPEFKKISDVVWEISKNFKNGMRVPVRIYGTKKIVEDMDLQVYDQASNVATLPGIQKYSFVMPDGHSGYGFSIGGVAAFDINNGGIISPGGIGFDINCLSGETEILYEHGYRKKISDIESEWPNSKLACINFDKKFKDGAEPIAFIKKKNDKKVFKIQTMSGLNIVATEDHPFFSKNGMIPVGELKINSIIAAYPFRGVEYEVAEERVIINEKNLQDLQVSVDKKIIMEELKGKNLMPLKLNSKKIPYLIKILAYNTGDGTLTLTKSSHNASFYGPKEDLELIRKDVKKIGFTPSKIYKRRRKHRIETKYGIVKFTFDEFHFKVNSRSFVVLLNLLGAPLGEKTNTPFLVPSWLSSSPKWYKRLFLAAFFDAEMSAPATLTKHGYNFYMPYVSVNKRLWLVENGKDFLKGLALMLDELGIECSDIKEAEEYLTKHGTTKRLKLMINGNPENLINLYEKVGFEYSVSKKFLSNVAAMYLRLKLAVINTRKFAEDTAEMLYKEGVPTSEIYESLTTKFVNKRFLQRSLFESRKTSPRIAFNFPTFDEFMKIATKNLGKSGMVWDTIENIQEIKFDDYVYDFSMNHNSHNFLANGLVVSNCGMRLILTNLTVDDVKPHLKTLVDKLFQKVPAGVGSSGFVKLTKDQFKKVTEEGTQWAVKNGYGWDEDLERTELNGTADWADNTKISSRAIERGHSQIGTLGSGNHYLEIQHVRPENIQDEKLAKKWGIFPNQIVIMFHCGSRGFGHQIGSDYLELFLNVMERKYGIKILDRELACAPFNSPEGQDYWKAMACGVNMSFVNRQVILHRIREVFSEVFKQDAEKLGLRMVFDISHNRASLEKHEIDGELKELLVHRKGATAAYYAGREEIPKLYKDDGIPVIIGGSMETGSYLLVGSEGSKETFCSTAHGSGRTMSRTKAKNIWRGEQLLKDMEKRGIYVKSVSFSGVAEEAGGAYKEIDEVIQATALADISKPVVKLVPLGNVKG